MSACDVAMGIFALSLVLALVYAVRLLVGDPLLVEFERRTNGRVGLVLTLLAGASGVGFLVCRYLLT